MWLIRIRISDFLDFSAKFSHGADADKSDKEFSMHVQGSVQGGV